jgi:hypothetical protein
MPGNVLTFSELLNRLRLIGADVVPSPPAPEGSIWLFGKGKGSFPWTRGPIYPVRNRAGDQPIPRRMAEKILKHLGLADNDRAAFWNARSHSTAPPRHEA